MKDQLNFMQDTHRHFMGENLLGLSLKDLQKLESQLEVGINRVRERKSQLLLEQIHELRRKEHVLLQENEKLRTKLANTANMQVDTVMNAQDAQDSLSVKASSLPPGSAQQNESSITNAETTLQLGYFAA